jgi:signal transduction histidine kinase
MRERANLLGGRLVVSSAPGKGTAIEARLPASPPSMSVAG